MLQQKTQRPVQFEVTPPTREALEAWIKLAGLKSDSFLFPVGCTADGGVVPPSWSRPSNRTVVDRPLPASDART